MNFDPTAEYDAMMTPCDLQPKDPTGTLKRFHTRQGAKAQKNSSKVP